MNLQPEPERNSLLALIGPLPLCYRLTRLSSLSISLSFFSPRFSVNVLLSLCQQTEDRPLAGVVVIGNGQSARAVALAGSAMHLPVLWAKGGTANLDGLHREVSAFYALQQ